VLKGNIDDTIFIIANPLLDTALINLNPKLRKLYLYLLSFIILLILIKNLIKNL